MNEKKLNVSENTSLPLMGSILFSWLRVCQDVVGGQEVFVE